MGAVGAFCTSFSRSSFGPWPRASNHKPQTNMTKPNQTSPTVPPYAFFSPSGDILACTGDRSPAFIITPRNDGVTGIAISNPVALTTIATLSSARFKLEFVRMLDDSKWQLTFKLKRLKLALILAKTDADALTQAALNSGHQIVVVAPAA